MDHNDIEMTDLEGEQREIAECIGIDAYRTLAQTYGGSSIYIAKIASILKDARDRRIRREYNGCNAHALAIKYDSHVPHSCAHIHPPGKPGCRSVPSDAGGP